MLIRAMGGMTAFDLHEIFLSVRDLPHHENEDGYYFDLDQWDPNRISALWQSVQDRRKRIHDVWKSELSRSDFIGALSVQFGPKRASAQRLPEEYCVDNGRRVKILHMPTRHLTEDERMAEFISRKQQKSDAAESEMSSLSPLKNASRRAGPSLNAMLKKRKAAHPKAADPAAASSRKKRKDVHVKKAAAATSDSEVDEDDEKGLLVLSSSDDMDWNDPRLEDSDSDSDSMGGLF